MGKKRLTIIDDSQPEVQEKKASKKRVVKSEPENQLSVLGGQLSDTSSPVVSESVQEPETDQQKTDKPESENRKQKTDNRKPGKAKPRSLPRAKSRGKKYQEAVKDLDRTKTYPIPDAVDMVKKISYAKFNATLEAHINTAALGLRGLVSLPYASGKKLKILVFGHLPSLEEYEGIVFGDDSTIEQINQGKVDFNLVITTPEWMPKLAKAAKVLGPKGLMPNPKNGTITSPSADGLKKAVERFQAGKTEYKTESKAPVIHLGLGKLNQSTEELAANVKTLLQTIGKTKVKKVSLSPTMGPSVKLDLASI